MRPALPPLQRSVHPECVAEEGTNECATPESGTRSAVGQWGVRIGGGMEFIQGPQKRILPGDLTYY